jgi:hypothetical protein
VYSVRTCQVRRRTNGRSGYPADLAPLSRTSAPPKEGKSGSGKTWGDPRLPSKSSYTPRRISYLSFPPSSASYVVCVLHCIIDILHLQPQHFPELGQRNHLKSCRRHSHPPMWPHMPMPSRECTLSSTQTCTMSPVRVAPIPTCCCKTNLPGSLCRRTPRRIQDLEARGGQGRHQAVLEISQRVGPEEVRSTVADRDGQRRC